MDPLSLPSASPVLAPAPLATYLTGEDQLRLTVLNGAASVRVQLSGRFLNSEGRIVSFAHDVLPATDRTASTLTRALGAGWLLEASVRAIVGTPLIGQCFAILSIVRGSTGAIVDLSTLAAGYVTAVQRLAWPGSPIQSSLEGAGALRSITGATPGAGAEISETVPTGARWDLLAVQFTLTSSATVATRSVFLRLDDGTNDVFRADANFAHVASTVGVYNFGQGLVTPLAAHIGGLLAGLPINIRLGAAFRWRTLTSSIQVGDQYSAVQYLVREWIEGA
jgi:hypothetical protein